MNIIKSLKSASISAKKYSAQLFADAVLNTTGDSDLSPGMKIFYDTALLQNVGSQTYFAQFGKQQPLPKHRGKKLSGVNGIHLPFQLFRFRKALHLQVTSSDRQALKRKFINTVDMLM